MHKKMKFNLTISAVAILTLLITGCSSSVEKETKTKKTTKEVAKEVKVINKDEIDKVYVNPNEYKDSKIELYGKVFQMKSNNGKTILQVWGDPKNSEKNTVIEIAKKDLNVKTEDIVHIVGTVKGELKGENAFGGKVSALSVLASEVEKSDYATAFSPAIKTIEVNQNQQQNNLFFEISKIEIAKEETRVFLKITNNTQETASFYSFNSKLIQGSKQFDEKENYEAKYPEVQSEILPGVTTEGIITFENVDMNNGNIKISLEGSNENYDLEFNPYVFDIALQ